MWEASAGMACASLEPQRQGHGPRQPPPRPQTGSREMALSPPRQDNICQKDKVRARATHGTITRKRSIYLKHGFERTDEECSQFLFGEGGIQNNALHALCKLHFIETTNSINHNTGLFKAKTGPSDRVTNPCNSFKAGF